MPLLTPPSMYTVNKLSLQGGQEGMRRITFSLLEHIRSLPPQLVKHLHSRHSAS